jgi:hypothetical protein
MAAKWTSLLPCSHSSACRTANTLGAATSSATPRRTQAFWTFNNGFGIADSTQEVVFDDNGKRVIELRDSSRTIDAQRLLHTGKAELQLLLDRYMEFDQ